MEQDKLLNSLKLEIKGNLTPVRPLVSPVLRSVLFLPVWAALAGISAFGFGLREDYAQLGGWATFGLAGVQLVVACVLILIGLRNTIPGMMTSPLLSRVATVLSVVAFLLTCGVIYSISPVAPPAGMALGKGVACLSLITVLGLAPLAFGLLLTSRGLPLRVGALGIMVGLGSGLCMEAAWRLHCQFSDPGHVLIAHGGGIFILSMLGVLAVSYWRWREEG